MMKTHWKTCLSIGACAFLLYLAIHYWPAASGFFSSVFSAAMPLLLGAAGAYLINILMSFYERHYFPKSQGRWVSRSRRPVCMTGAMVTLAAIVVLVIALVLPQLTSCVSLLLSALPAALDRLVSFLSQLEVLPEDMMAALASVNWQEKIGEIAGTLVTGVGNLMNVLISAVSTLVSAVTTTVFAFIFAIYLLAGKERLAWQGRRFLQHYLPETWYRRLMYVLSVFHDTFHRFIVGQCTEAVILGTLCTIGMLLLRLPYATMVGALIGFTALIPVAGAFIGGALGAFLILVQSPVQALIFLVFLIVLQQVEGNLIYPKVVGSSIGLPAIWVLAVVTVGGSVLGIGGILLGIPIAAGIYRLIANDMRRNQAPVQEEKERA